MIAIVFPGQGSQKPGMGKELFDQIPESRKVFDQVSEAIGSSMESICFEMDEEELRQTQNAQLALYTVGLAAWKALEAAGISAPSYFAGHSVGEYAAIAAAGAISIPDGARLVQRRGELMKHAPNGSMAAVLGMERDALQAVCDEINGVVVIANDNSPGQLVISGDVGAVEAAGKLASERGARRVLPLNVSGAFHSPLMEAASVQMGQALRDAAWTKQQTVCISNVTAEPVFDQSPWAELLEEQLRSPVRWTESVRTMRSLGVTHFIECGSGEVLTGLLKRIDSEAIGLSVGNPDSAAAVASQLKVNA